MIIAINGPAGAGKDSIAQILSEEFGYVRIGFADALKDAVLTLNPVLETKWEVSTNESYISPKLSYFRLNDAIDAFGWDKAKRQLPEIRRLLQATGVGYRDLFGQDVWVNKVQERIKFLDKTSGQKDICIPDLRFSNEAEMIRSYGGVVIRVERPDNPYDIGKSHISEQLSVDTPYVIVNDGTFEELKNKILLVRNEIIDSLRSRRRYVFNGEMQCNSCDRWLPLENFHRSNRTISGREGSCAQCANSNQKSKPSRQPDARAIEYRKRDKAALTEYNRSKLLSRYGLTTEQYEIMWLAQEGLCGICKCPETRLDHRTNKPIMLSVDHDHNTSKVRGLLCSKHNKAIGLLGDTAEEIHKAYLYLKKYE